MTKTNEKSIDSLPAVIKRNNTKSSVETIINVVTTENVSIKLRQIIAILKEKSGYDFSHYKHNSILRSIQKRMKTLQIDTLSAYIAYIHQHLLEPLLLTKTLLIHVTEFFRDENAFELLKNELLTKMLKSSLVNNRFRVWIPACSTGEEAYSVAIVLQECMNQLNIYVDVRIFATDFSEEMIEIARKGFFSASIEKNVSPDRLQTFFIKTQVGYHIKPEVRKMIVFAEHNVINDPPFTHLDLLCCRNLFIYLKLSAQNKIIALFHQNLNPNGLLLLGASEYISDSIYYFNTLNNKWRLYERKNNDMIMGINKSPLKTELTSPVLTKDKRLNSSVTEPIHEKNSPSEGHLSYTKNKLQIKIEALEESIEELKAIHKESQAMNETSQAMNEELQSLNESLSSTHLEMQNYIEHLLHSKIEISNLLHHIDIATLFLDRNLCIKHFTPKTTEMINLISADLGRPVNHISSNIQYQYLSEDAQTVLNTLVPIEKECLDHQGRHCLIRIKPYLSTDDLVDGVVVTFVSI